MALRPLGGSRIDYILAPNAATAIKKARQRIRGDGYRIGGKVTANRLGGAVTGHGRRAWYWYKTVAH